MTKSEITIKINSISMEILSDAIRAIEYSNPVNAFTRNRAYINRSTRGGDLLKIEISFQTRAIKENMMNVYHAILDEIICKYDLSTAQAIEPGYIPAWYQEPAEEPEEITMEEYQRKENEFATRTDALCENVHSPAGSATCEKCPCKDLCKWLYDNHPFPINNPWKK